MSTYYRPDGQIPISEVKSKCDFDVINEIDGMDGFWFKDAGDNYLHYALSNDEKYVIDIFRYGRNDPSYILNDLELKFNVKIYSEHEDEYQKCYHHDSPVMTLTFDDGIGGAIK